MRRLLLGLALGVLIAVPSGYAGAKLVSNPMSGDLDGGGYSLFDLRNVTLDGDLTATKGILYLDGNHNRPSVRWGTESPVTDPRAIDAQPGSLFLEYALDQESAWIKTGPNQTDWRQLAFAP